MSGTVETRLRRLEDQRRTREPMRGFYIITRADDAAEHERQAAEQKAALGYIDGHPLIHIRTRGGL